MEQKLFRASAGEPLATTAEQIGEKLRQALRLVERVADCAPDLHVVPLAATEVTEKAVRAILKARRIRSKHFDESLFADPAWDILLELYAAELSNQPISVSALCIGASVPATTALRWISDLNRRGLLVRLSDPTDSRRTFVRLSEEGKKRVAAYFADVPRSVLPI